MSRYPYNPTLNQQLRGSDGGAVDMGFIAHQTITAPAAGTADDILAETVVSNIVATVADAEDLTAQPDVARCLTITGNNVATKASLLHDSAAANSNLTFTADTAGLDGNDITIEITDPGVAGALDVVLDGTDISVTLAHSAAVAATLTHDSAAANSDLTFDAVSAGADGNDITIEIVDPGEIADLSIVLVGTAITVNLAYAAGNRTSNANDVKNALDAVPEIAALVDVTVEGDGSGLVDALTETPLASGSDGATTTTATLLKAALDDVPGIAALIDTAKEGDGSGLVDPLVQTSLEGGLDKLVGNVVVVGTDIAGNALTETLVLNGSATVTGTKAFKTVSSITLPVATNFGGGDSVKVGQADKLGLMHELPHNTVFMTFLDDVKEANAPTVTTSATVLAQNTIDLDSALDGNDVDVYYVA